MSRSLEIYHNIIMTYPGYDIKGGIHVRYRRTFNPNGKPMTITLLTACMDDTVSYLSDDGIKREWLRCKFETCSLCTELDVEVRLVLLEI
jgi:hypothetical protein